MIKFGNACAAVGLLIFAGGMLSLAGAYVSEAWQTHKVRVAWEQHEKWFQKNAKPYHLHSGDVVWAAGPTVRDDGEKGLFLSEGDEVRPAENEPAIIDDRGLLLRSARVFEREGNRLVARPQVTE